MSKSQLTFVNSDVISFCEDVTGIDVLGSVAFRVVVLISFCEVDTGLNELGRVAVTVVAVAVDDDDDVNVDVMTEGVLEANTYVNSFSQASTFEKQPPAKMQLETLTKEVCQILTVFEIGQIVTLRVICNSLYLD